MSVKGSKGKGGAPKEDAAPTVKTPQAKGATPATLVALDGLDVDALVLLIGEDERPLTGAAGLLDWRMCGWLSQQLQAGVFSGKAGERVLTWPAGRVGVPAVLLLGVGPTAAVKDGLGTVLDGLSGVLEQAGLKRVALGACVPAAWVEEALGARTALRDRVKTLLEAVPP